MAGCATTAAWSIRRKPPCGADARAAPAPARPPARPGRPWRHHVIDALAQRRVDRARRDRREAGDDAAAGGQIALPARHHMAGHVAQHQSHDADLRQPEAQRMRELDDREHRQRRVLRRYRPARGGAQRRDHHQRRRRQGESRRQREQHDLGDHAQRPTARQSSARRTPPAARRSTRKCNRRHGCPGSAPTRR